MYNKFDGNDGNDGFDKIVGNYGNYGEDYDKVSAIVETLLPKC